jgi:hypothetical protein
LTDVSEVRTASITSETSVNFNVTTPRYIPEDSKHRGIECFVSEYWVTKTKGESIIPGTAMQLEARLQGWTRI